MRLFVGIFPPADAVTHLADALAANPLAIGLRRQQPPDRWHLTLAFLGEVTPERMEDLSAPLSAVCGTAPTLRLRLAGSGSFRTGSGAGAFWIGVTGAGLSELAARVSRLRGEYHRATRYGTAATVVGFEGRDEKCGVGNGQLAEPLLAPDRRRHLDAGDLRHHKRSWLTEGRTTRLVGVSRDQRGRVGEDDHLRSDATRSTREVPRPARCFALRGGVRGGVQDGRQELVHAAPAPRGRALDSCDQFLGGTPGHLRHAGTRREARGTWRDPGYQA